jgi:SPP1 gp7 family putative phage head morphogenesis protein
MNPALRSHLAEAIAQYILDGYPVQPGHTHAKMPISHEVYFDVLFKALAPWERRIIAMLAVIWDEERRIILANLKKLKPTTPKAKAPQGIIDSLLYPKNKFTAALSAEAKKIIMPLIVEEGKRILAILDVDIDFDVADPNVEAWLAEYTPKFSRELEAVNVEKLRAELTAGMDAGETIPQLMARVNETYATWNKYRAEIIARTETSRASNRAALEGYRQSGVVRRKVWMTAPGCCDECAALDGTVIGLDEEFFDTDYESGDGPPLHPNCRCAVAPEID